MGLSRTTEWFSLPFFIILQAAPMAAVVPLVTYIYGIGLTSKVLAVVVLAAPVIVMNSYKGIRNTNPSLIQMCRAFLGNPDAGGGEDHSSACCGDDLHRTTAGVGDGIHRSGDRGAPHHADRDRRPDQSYHSSVADFPEMFAAVASIILIAAVTIHGLERLERRLFPPEVRGS